MQGQGSSGLLEEGKGRFDEANTLGQFAVPCLFLARRLVRCLNGQQAVPRFGKHLPEICGKHSDRSGFLGLEQSETLEDRFQSIGIGAASSATGICLLVAQDAEQESVSSDLVHYLHGLLFLAPSRSGRPGDERAINDERSRHLAGRARGLRTSAGVRTLATRSLRTR